MMRFKESNVFSIGSDFYTKLRDDALTLAYQTKNYENLPQEERNKIYDNILEKLIQERSEQIMNYYDVTYREEGSNIYQAIIVQASRSELAEQYVKEFGGIIAGVVEKANIDEDKRKGKPIVTIHADRLLTKPYIETLLKEERLWKEGEADTFQYENWVLTLSKENKEYFPFKYAIEGKKIGTNETWCRRYMSMYRALLHIVNDFNENINIKDNYGNLSEYIYPVGTRIELAHMNDPQAVPSRTRGTVDHIDDAGQIHMKWDNGSSLAVILEVDDFRLLTDDEIKAEKEQVKNEPDMADDYDY